MLDRTLPPELVRALEQLSHRDELQELRFRCGSPVKAVYPWGETLLTIAGRPVPVTDKLIKTLLDRATGFSPYALRLEESGLYLPLENGCRMGLCGEAVVRDGTLTGLRRVSSLVIRVARERRGIAEGAAGRITAPGYPGSVLIVSPPGRGKTTFLRDLIRAVSERGFRVSVADERRELAAWDGGMQMDLGPCTDVLSGCPKAQAMPLLLRVMNPQVLAVDELAGPAELQIAREAAHCGVALFATAHGADLADLNRRPGYRELFRAGTFAWCITLKTLGTYEMERLDGHVEDHGSVPGCFGVGHGRLGGPAGHAAAAAAPATAAFGAGADAGGDGIGHAHGAGVV